MDQSVKKAAIQISQVPKRELWMPKICAILLASANNTKRRKYAGIAQLVERNLAKVEVASSSLVSRSIH